MSIKLIKNFNQITLKRSYESLRDKVKNKISISLSHDVAQTSIYIKTRRTIYTHTNTIFGEKMKKIKNFFTVLCYRNKNT